jgi:hypothetical protein
MADNIRIDPRVLREVGDHHDEVADQIAAARLAGDEIGAAVSSYGPIMNEVKAAVADLLSQREAALLSHEEAHRAAAGTLRNQAAAFAEQEAINAERLTF